MGAPARALLSDLPKGFQFPETSFELTSEDIAHYLDAVQDANGIYSERGLAPPLAVAARALGALLEAMELPPGTLHTGQEIEPRAGVPIGASVVLNGWVAQRSERAGLVISVIEFEVTLAGARELALAGRTTVMAPKSAVAGEQT